MKQEEGPAILYYCDPEKHTECSKRSCAYVPTKEEGGICCATFRRAFARTDENGVPMIYKIIKNGRVGEECTES